MMTWSLLKCIAMMPDVYSYPHLNSDNIMDVVDICFFFQQENSFFKLYVIIPMTLPSSLLDYL